MPDTVNVMYRSFVGLGRYQCVEVGPGLWCWTTPGFAWQFNERIGPPRPNVGMQLDGKFDYQLRAGTLDEAIIYTVGFSYGYKNGLIQGKLDSDTTTKDLNDAFNTSVEKERAKPGPEVKADPAITGPALPGPS